MKMKTTFKILAAVALATSCASTANAGFSVSVFGTYSSAFQDNKFTNVLMGTNPDLPTGGVVYTITHKDESGNAQNFTGSTPNDNNTAYISTRNHEYPVPKSYRDHVAEIARLEGLDATGRLDEAISHGYADTHDEVTIDTNSNPPMYVGSVDLKPFKNFTIGANIGVTFDNMMNGGDSAMGSSSSVGLLGTVEYHFENKQSFSTITDTTALGLNEDRKTTLNMETHRHGSLALYAGPEISKNCGPMEFSIAVQGGARKVKIEEYRMNSGSKVDNSSVTVHDKWVGAVRVPASVTFGVGNGFKVGVTASMTVPFSQETEKEGYLQRKGASSKLLRAEYSVGLIIKFAASSM